MSDHRADIEAGVRRLTAWAPAVRIEEISPAALRRALLILADDLGAIVASRAEPEVAGAHDRLLRQRRAEEATVFRGGRPRTDRTSAAVANAIAANWAELDEGYRKATCHAGLYTLPALLAEAEASGLTLGDLLRIAVVSYEITTRFARAWTFPPVTLHPHATFAAVGAATATALARRLEGDAFLAALTGATTLVAVGPYDHAVKGALVRNVWAAAGAWNGMSAVDWATCGIGGLPGTPYDVYSRALGGQAHPERLTADLGREWAIEDGYHKAFACCQYAHSAIEAALGVLDELPAARGGARIARVVVETHPLGLSLDNYEPPTSLAAKFSLPHCIAATLVLGHADPEAFAAASLERPEIARLRERVALERHPGEKPWPYDRPARVTVELLDGTRLSKTCDSARGGPDRPFSPAEIIAKVGALTATVYPDLAPRLEGLLALDGAQLGRRWDDLLTGMIGKE